VTSSAPRVLFLSNGYGEDWIAGTIIDRVSRADLVVHGWPMVGAGEAYRERGVPIVGAPNRLPSCGFATMSARLFWTDLRAGWTSTHWRQVSAARRLRGRYDLAVAVGDVVVMAAARLARLPFLFVGSAKSAHYRGFLEGYTRLEKRLLRRHCLRAFPRDEATAREMDRAGIRHAYVGNPMMDDLEGTGEMFGLPPDRTVVALLPGSRADAVDNARSLLAVAAATAGVDPRRAPAHFLFAVAPGFDHGRLARELAGDPRMAGWRREPPEAADAARDVVLRLGHPGGAAAWIAVDRLADVLRRAALVVGLAGTANEQAVGLGKPLVTFPTRGVQGRRYARMKAEYFGDAALTVSPEPARVAEAIVALLDDPARCARMAAAGRDRMGGPGASDAIAAALALHLKMGGSGRPPYPPPFTPAPAEPGRGSGTLPPRGHR
jgi:uncharacterized protein (TIGR03492 family)